MTVHARRIASIPRRSPVETWRTICELLTTSGTSSRTELEAITGIAAALITEEYMLDVPIVVSGSGPQVRIYTLHGQDAIDADLNDELPLNHDPTAGEWTLSLPCGIDDLEEATAATSSAPHVEVRWLEDDATTAKAVTGASGLARRPVIDLAEMERS